MNFSLQTFHGILDTQFANIGHWQFLGQQRIPHHIVTHSRRLMYRFGVHFHPYAERLLQELVANDVAGLARLDTANPELREDFFVDRYKPTTAIAVQSIQDIGTVPAAVLASVNDTTGVVVRNLLPVKNLDFDYAEGAYAVYNWEVFYHVPYLVATQLSSNQRFEEAQQWFHYIFDPTDNSDGPAPQRFWKVKPFQVDSIDSVQEILLNLSTGDNLDLQNQTIAAIGAWRSNPFRPHLVARTRPTAYMYATVMAYLDNLIAWGDSLFRQDTREAINEATQYYVLAAKILGPNPQVVPRVGTLKNQSYNDLRQDLDEFGNAARDLEANIPFDLHGPALPNKGSPAHAPLESLGRTLYFCVPRNDKLLGYWATVGDRLYKIRNSLNLAGIFRQLPLFPPPIDPALLARATAAGVDVASIIAGTAAPLTPVRFQTLLQKAIEVAQEVKSLGGQLLATLEKKDNEALTLLRAQNEGKMLALAEAVKSGQLEEATKNKEGVLQNLINVFERYRYYDRLLGTDDSLIQPKKPLDADYSVLNAPSSDGNAPDMTALKTALAKTEPTVQADDVTVTSSLNSGHQLTPSESSELQSLNSAQSYTDVATVMEVIAAACNVIPAIGGYVTPIGVGANATFGGSNIAAIFQGIAAGERGAATGKQHDATLSAKIAGYERREQEWSYQRRAAAGEMSLLYKQYRAAELREFIAQRDYENHLQQIKQAKDIEDFLSNEQRKTTTVGFYLWMKGEAQGLYGRFFQFALDVAKLAERAYQFEIGDLSASFLGVGYLGGRQGLFAGEKLLFDLKQMDMAYATNDAANDHQLTKSISVRDWFPDALWHLRRDGKCHITIPEALFDLDCPGHYFRRLDTVSVSVPCVAGPYASVNCSLTLSSSSVRTSYAVPSGGWYASEDPGNADSTVYASYVAAKRFVVTSSGQNDIGLFEANVHSDHYRPFEGEGVFSTWDIELLGSPRQFDYGTISDLVLTVRYKARSGAPGDTVNSAVAAWLKAHSKRAFSMRHEFPTEWARFTSGPVPPGQKASLVFTLTDDHFPYRMQNAWSNAKQLQLFGETAAPQVSVELFRASTSLGTTNLGNGVGSIPQSGPSAGFDPRGAFELRCDSNSFLDLWLVFDWESP